METKFECKKCGHCCKHLDEGGATNKLPLWEWEVERLKDLAEEKGIQLIIEPVDLILDKKTNRAICTQFYLKAPCPFLKENKCIIYKDRPLVCKAFPMVNNPYFSKEIINLDIGNCNGLVYRDFTLAIKGNLDNDKTFMKKQEAAKRYRKFFGDEIFINSFLVGQIDTYTKQIIRDLLQDKKIKPRKLSKFDYYKYTPTPFFEFLIIKGLMNEEGKEYLIKELTNYNKVIEKID